MPKITGTSVKPASRSKVSESKPKPKASAAEFVLSRTDNLLSTSTLTYQERIVPLGYPKTITGDIAFNNPALRVIKS